MLGEALGRPVRVVVRRHNSPCIEAAFERARRRVFGPTLAKKDVRGLLRCLQSGEPVVYSADQNFTYQNEFVPFFGIPAATLTSTPGLVRRAHATMLVFFFHRRDDGRYHLRIGTAWPGWQEAPAGQAASIYMRELEKEVRAHPEQYLWAHRRSNPDPRARHRCTDQSYADACPCGRVLKRLWIQRYCAGTRRICFSIRAMIRAVSAAASSLGKSDRGGPISTR